MRVKLAVGFLVLALSMAPAIGKSPPARAIIEPAHIVEAIQLQQEADAAKDRPPQNGEPWFAVREGARPIIVTAPHATSPFREGQYRFSDGGGTAALAAMLHNWPAPPRSIPPAPRRPIPITTTTTPSSASWLR